uniref:cupin domain-containing protein n=1 Tax=Alcaligenes faecalis TaxID=511 RepID=UPI003F68971B
MENKPDHWARVASADLEHVRKSVSDMFKSHQLKQLRADQTLQTRLRHAQFGQVALSRLGYGADVHIQPDHLAGFYLVQMPQYGTAKIRCGGQTVDSSPYAATILNPNEDVDMVWHANNEQLMLKIDRNLVEQAARGMGLDVGPQGLLFPVRLEAHTQPSWQIMLRYVLDCARNYEDIRRSPLIINQLEQLAVTTLLDLHPPAQIQALNPARILPRHLKKVASHLHEQAPFARHGGRAQRYRRRQLAHLAASLQGALWRQPHAVPAPGAPGPSAPRTDPFQRTSSDAGRSGHALGLCTPGPFQRRISQPLWRNAWR